ncbi:Transcriptional regulatory protein, C terminal [Pseudobutyrivibrio sp. JW11]|uniref:response regulator transcription factor n=1 Tax=Pseudobutyrivibrio sp. JW11 TaxID=1855302 RepID=UPI0008EE2B66|nr:response regulator transcription factor [Pseudobutyrivibrio sp. JW11]SFN82625.1 Transcriptional regulatory protein, C terminal [Pseudobutyrivibrio sp. JW11]
MSQKVLVIEDDEDLLFIYKVRLKDAGYEVYTAVDRKTTEDMIRDHKFDIILIDMMLIGITGIELCPFIREHTDAPIIFISCIGDNVSKIDAFDAGADDYMVKPIDYQELVSRMAANIRRANSGFSLRGEKEVRHFQQFDIDEKTHTVYSKQNGQSKEVALSPTEYNLLTLFVNHADELIMYDRIYREIWGCSDEGDVRTVMVHISNLRKKIDLEKRDCIHTVRSAGYIFTDK